MKLVIDESDAIALIESLVRDCVALRTEIDRSRATADDALTRWQDVADKRGEQLAAIEKQRDTLETELTDVYALKRTLEARVSELQQTIDRLTAQRQT